MKFTLLEHNKFILSEAKFILNEDSTAPMDAANQLIDAIRAELTKADKTGLLDIVDKILAVVDSFEDDEAGLKKAYDDLQAAEENVKNTSALPTIDYNDSASLVQLTADLNDFLTKLDKAANEYQNFTGEDAATKYAVDTTIAKLRSDLGSGKIKSAVNYFNQLVDNFVPLLDPTDLTSTDPDKVTKAAFKDVIANGKIIKKALGSATTIVSKGHLESLNTKELREYIDGLKNLHDSIKKLTSATIDFDGDDVDKVVIPGLEEIVKNIEALQKTAGGTASTASTLDWAARYAKCQTTVDFDIFWNGNPVLSDPVEHAGYYNYEWGDKAEAIKALGPEFKKVLINNGWDAIKNPIIKFLKSDAVEPLLGTTLKRAQFETILNAVRQDWLVAKDFDSDRGTFGEYNIIFNKNLYDLSVTDMDFYLKSQNEVRQNAINLPPATYSWYKASNGNKGTVLNNILLDAGNSKDLMAAIKPGGPFRNKTRVSQILEAIKPENSEEKDHATDATIKDILAKVTTRDTAKKLLSYLVDALRIDFYDTIAKVNKATKTKNDLYNNRTTTPTSYDDTVQYDTWMQFKGLKYSKPQIETLLRELAKIAGFID